MKKIILKDALSDISAALKRYTLAGMLGWQDVKQRYRRSAIGPFWITISMGVMIATIGLVFGQIFNSPMSEFLPFLTAGMILWTFISTVLTEGCFGFISADSVIKQLPIPLFVHVMRLIWRNILILMHNFFILPVVFLAVAKIPSFLAFLSIPGFILLVLNLSWLVLILSVLCARYRDLSQIVNSGLQVIFYLTPIVWMPVLLPQRAGVYLLDLNPFFHIIEIVRAPLLGKLPTTVNWSVSIAAVVIGWSIALYVHGKYKKRIAYWV